MTRSLPSSLPRITYHRCLSSWFTLEGEAYQVRACPPFAFCRWLEQTTQGDPELHEQIHEELLIDKPDSDSSSTKWYSVLLMLEQGYPIKLFATKEEALASLQVC